MSIDLDQDDWNLTLLLATSSASLDRSSKKNWVENSGGLPPYIRKLARAIEKNGKSLSQAIAIAISRVRKWAAGGDDVDADTQAKAAKALAQWEKTKAKNKARQVVKASGPDDGFYLTLAAGDIPGGSFETERVTRAWHSLQSAARDAYYETHRAKEPNDGSPYRDTFPYLYIRSLWTDFIIVEHEQAGGPLLLKIPYTVSDTSVDFGQPVAVKASYEEVGLSHSSAWDPAWDESLHLSAEGVEDDLTPNEILLLKAEA